MTMTTTEDVARIAASLTKAQRRSVVRGDGGSVSVRAVLRHQPALFGRADCNAGYGWLQFPTTLGEQVRNYLIERARS